MIENEKQRRSGKINCWQEESKNIKSGFLYQYEPGKITIEKLIEDFGQPLRKSKYEEHENLFLNFKMQN